MARLKTKTGDGYPLDVTGNFLFEGAIVAFSSPAAEPPPQAGEFPRLQFGFIKKLGKSYTDVITPEFDSSPEEKFRLKEPARRLILVEPDTLSSLIPQFENLKMEAAKAKTY